MADVYSERRDIFKWQVMTLNGSEIDQNWISVIHSFGLKYLLNTKELFKTLLKRVTLIKTNNQEIT